MQAGTPIPTTLLAALTLSLAACGGGGGGSPSAAPAAEASTPATTPALAAGVAGVVPGATMSWSTTGETTLSVNVTGIDGRPAAGAAVRVFTLSRISPQDGSALEAPVPVSLLDTAVSDAAGRATLPLRLPAHLGELLVVATLGDAQAQGAVTTDAAANLALLLAR